MPDADEIEPRTSEEQTPGGTGEQTPVDAGGEDGQDGDTFPREYVEKLRKESASYRERVKEAEAQREEYAARLHRALVEATGLLADPSDLPFDAEHLDDPAKLAAAIERLVAAKPHLRSRKPSGDVGQGVKGAPAPANLLSILKSVI